MAKYITYKDTTGDTCEVNPSYNVVEADPRFGMSEDEILALVLANDIPTYATDITVVDPDAS